MGVAVALEIFGLAEIGATAAVMTGYAVGATALTVGGVFVATAVNIGLAYGANRIINGNPRDQRGANTNQGTRVQLAPATDSKIPVIYGSAHQMGLLTDAQISNSNKTMTYVLVLSEYVADGNWSVGNIYWNDQLLTFKPDGYTVATSIANNEISSKLDGLVRVWVWAGGSSAAKQIFGPATPVNAYDIIPGATSDYRMSDLVFAVVQLDYKSENGVTGLPGMTFQINNSLNNPGDVWVDYLKNTRYGAGIPISEINTASAVRLANLSNTIPPNQREPWPLPTSTTTTASNQVRYSINGVFNTGESVKNNLDKIDMACSSWTTYDYQLGQWSTIPNYAVDSGVLATAFQFTDDNIIGDINVTATNLEDLYNSVEVGFADRNNRDQTSYYTTATSVALRNDLEPDNQLRLNTDMINNALQAGRVGQIELRQSRIDLIINFTADYSALSVVAGDVVKITNSVYGFNNALFRVTRVQEVESEDGMIVAGITALQYDAAVYADTELSDYNVPPITDIPIFGGSTALAPPSKPVVTDDPTNAQFVVSSTVSATNYPVNRVEFYFSTDVGGPYQALSLTVSPFNPGDTITSPVSYYAFINGNYYFKTRVGAGNLLSDYSPVSDVFVFSNGNIIDGGGVDTALNADNVQINSSPPLQGYRWVGSITTSTGFGNYGSLEASDGLRWNADTNKLYIGGWEVSTTTNYIP
jgi:hypothetical protein